MNEASIELILPDWPVPAGVRAVSTTRSGGVSAPPFDTLNLGGHTGDDPAAVAENRRWLAEAAGMPSAPRWLNQVHGTDVLHVTEAGAPEDADAAWTDRPGRVCAVLTADCLPVILAAVDGSAVGVAHAGWRGLSAGVLESLIDEMRAAPRELVAWLGPAIGPAAFEVGPEVREAFLARDDGAEAAFQSSPAGRWLADIYMLARRRLDAAGVEAVFGGGSCTVADSRRFFSYRRDGETGRMATAIWLEP
ncbi:peptidoglycan editing factor PgeF [Ectothiorhodospiraceae bacterium WFHF3C12]|nr:peptidoglycan editing factor PgeF [Ectothiorhodospiraceae bacterium WFHF3C12]